MTEFQSAHAHHTAWTSMAYAYVEELRIYSIGLRDGHMHVVQAPIRLDRQLRPVVSFRIKNSSAEQQ